MSLVKCNHCNKETVNNTGKCRWCNKELDKNIDNIEREINSTVKKQPLAEKDNFNWICDECNEENEPIYDVCWNCSTESEIAKTKYQEFSKEEVKNKKKEEEEKLIQKEVKDLEFEIEKSMWKYKIWIKPLSLFISFLIGGSIGLLIGYPFVLIFGDAAESVLFFSMLGSMVLVWKVFYGKIYGKLREKRMKQLGFDKHKYYNQIK